MSTLLGKKFSRNKKIRLFLIQSILHFTMRVIMNIQLIGGSIALQKDRIRSKKDSLTNGNQKNLKIKLMRSFKNNCLAKN